MTLSINQIRMTDGLDIENGVGLEIGPLVNPIVTRERGNINYVDRASTEDLREWYSRDPAINVDDIMHIDYVWGEQSLAEATGGSEQFDYLIASHVIEHIPDLITWLNEIASILKPGGIASFAVPDKRYTFDYLRPLTTTADLVESHLTKLRKPSFRHIYDHFANFTELDITTAWQPGFDGRDLTPQNSPTHAYKACLDALQNDSYIDSHCSVFTEESFFELLESVSSLGLLDFAVKRKFSTRQGMFEFFVHLEKLDSNLTDAEKHAAFKASMTAVRDPLLLIEFRGDRACNPKIYCDLGEGFNETDTSTVQYVASGEIKELEFILPSSDVVRLRIDPADHECELEITNIELVTPDGNRRRIALEALSPANQFASSEVQNGVLRARTEDGATDPFFLLETA